MNYLHSGASKIWYFIPDTQRERFEEIAKEKLAGVYKNDKNFLLDINTMISPSYLKAHGIDVYRTVQKEG